MANIDIDLMLRKVGQRVVYLSKGKQTPVCVMDGFPVHIHTMNYLLALNLHTDGFLCVYMDVHASHAAALN